MRAIYASANAVVVATEAAVAQGAGKILDLLNCIDPLLGIEDQSEQLSNKIKDDSTRSALQLLCNDNYWTRMWIIQEYAVANNLQFLIKDKLVGADRLHRLLLILNSEHDLEQWAQVRAVYNIRESVRRNQPFQLVQILEKTKSSACTQRHDRIFALMGLLLDALKYLLDSDYKAELTSTTLAMTRACIQNEGLDIVLLAPHRPPDSSLPTWCPNFFEFDIHHPEKRVVDLIVNSVQPPALSFYNNSPPRNATGFAKSDISYNGNTILTAACKIGTIRSLGRAWEDTSFSEFPAHDPDWTRTISSSGLQKEMFDAIYSAIPGLPSNMLAVHGYSFVAVFNPSHGSQGADYVHRDLVDWLCGNRTFFTGAHTMEYHAKKQPHPFFSHCLSMWGPEYYNDLALFDVVWTRFIDMAKSNMRLMCLDDGPEHRIGWAAPTARLYDEVFLVPGCNVPVILRCVEPGKYQLTGDAIVPGAMKNELWKNIKSEDLMNVEIV
jgi:hypothetical protein